MLIFLDIDGVMVPIKSWESPQNLTDGFPAFSKEAVDAINSILKDNDTIILTTSHKYRFELSDWKKIFTKRGVKIKNINRLTNNNGNLNRKSEILNWFESNLANDFIIIDDDKSLNDLPKNLKSNLILTSPMIGLKKEDIANRVRV